MPYSVRQAKPEDLAAVMLVERQSFDENIVEEENVFAERIAALFPQLERIILLVHENWHKAIRIYENKILPVRRF